VRKLNQSGGAAPQERRRWRAMVMALVVGTGFTLMSLWVGEFSPIAWWSSWRAAHQSAAVTTSQHPASAPITSPISITPPAPKGNNSSVSSAPVPLILVSTQPARTLSESLAMVGTEAVSPQTYVGGATLSNGARITDIKGDYIVLSKDGRSARLYRQGSASGIANHPELASLLLKVGGMQSEPATIEASREPITDYLRPSPVYDGDSLRGFQVYAGNRAGVFAQMGLQPGDVITALNGIPLTDPTSGVGMLEELVHGVSLDAQVERKGQRLALTLDGALIVSAERTLTAASATPPAMP